MAFCSKCGNHLEGNERFCVKCGADLAATPPSTTPPAAPVASPAPVAQYAAVPAGYPGGAPIPMAIPMPAPAAKRVPWVWIVLTVLFAGVAFYYYHKEQTLLALIQNAINSNNGGGGNNGGGNNGGNTGGGGNGGGGNGGGNNGGGGGNNTQALMQQQVWQMTQWNQTGGDVVVQGTWTNNSTTTLTNGTLTCTEYDANSTQLGTLTDTLLGPIKGNMVYTFNSINMGSPAANLNKLGCALTAITQ